MKRNPFFLSRVILTLLVCFISNTIMAQKVNLDTLDIGQLNLYKHKAVLMRNAGTILCFSSIGIIATGGVITFIKKQNVSHPDDRYEELYDGIPAILGVIASIPVAVIGISLREIGGRRIAKAELAIKKINAPTEKSMVLGVGITFRF